MFATVFFLLIVLVSEEEASYSHARSSSSVTVSVTVLVIDGADSDHSGRILVLSEVRIEASVSRPSEEEEP